MNEGNEKHLKTLDVKVIKWLENSLQSDIKSFTQLSGATSSKLYKIETLKENVVLRLFDNKEWLREEPDLAIHEGEALKIASGLNAATPKWISSDPDGKECGTPALLMSLVTGSVDLYPEDKDSWLEQLAKTLAEIHKISAEDFHWEYFTYFENEEFQVPSWATDPAVWEKALRIAKGPRPDSRTCFIHRDYHACNVVWKDGKLSGVVDWANACRGPAGFDVAHCRIDLAQLYGPRTADQFLQYYETHACESFRYDPYWDLVGLFDIGVFEESFDVYEGWRAFGVNDLTVRIIRNRIEEYLESLLERTEGGDDNENPEI
jgi:aminoglycoside phosphotransferase (APT) family kinase protein